MYNHLVAQDFFAWKIGNIARQVIDQGSAAVVLGITSRGTFLHVDQDWVIFLSTERFAGPLVLNLHDRPDGLTRGERFRIQHRIIRSQGAEILLDTNPAVEWTPPVRPGCCLSSAERRELLQKVVSEFSNQQFLESTRYSDLLFAMIPSAPNETKVESDLHTAFWNLSKEWTAALDCPVLPVTLQSALIAFLGMGSGLTPSGDDLVAGLLLAINRWGDVLAPGFQIRALNETVLSAAPKATTALSASILRCAAQAQADERLVDALDGLMTGQLGSMEIMEKLQTYGASSGLDTLAGFFIACG